MIYGYAYALVTLVVESATTGPDLLMVSSGVGSAR